MYCRMSVESMGAGQGGRGRGGRGAPFGNPEQRRELRRPMGSTAVTAESLTSQIQNLDIKNSFNINAHEFIPK